jgi:hypothetical protein
MLTPRSWLTWLVNLLGTSMTNLASHVNPPGENFSDMASQAVRFLHD